MSDIGKLVGERIRILRQAKGLSQEQLALRAELNTSFLGQVERGEKNPTIITLEKIVKALNITFEEFFSFKYDSFKTLDINVIDKISLHLEGRTIKEQEAVLEILRQVLKLKDGE